MTGRARLRNLGFSIGRFPAGPWNAITDVAGVRVGHTTLVAGDGPLEVGKGPVRTGVTAVMPNADIFNQRAVAGKDQTAGETTGAGRIGAVLGIKQPVVGAKRPMEPQGMVEARRHDGLLEYGAAMGNQRGVEQHHVRRIGEHALMDRGRIRQRPGGADPNVEPAAGKLGAEVAFEFDRTQLDRKIQKRARRDAGGREQTLGARHRCNDALRRAR